MPTEAVSRAMRANRTGNALELTARASLPSRGAAYDVAGLPGRPDVLYRGRRVAVFVHGCFWHRCPVHAGGIPRTDPAYWSQKFAANARRDRRAVRALRAAGWAVATIWEHELRDDPAKAGARVRRLLEARGG